MFYIIRNIVYIGIFIYFSPTVQKSFKFDQVIADPVVFNVTLEAQLKQLFEEIAQLYQEFQKKQSSAFFVDFIQSEAVTKKITSLEIFINKNVDFYRKIQQLILLMTRTPAQQTAILNTYNNVIKTIVNNYYLDIAVETEPHLRKISPDNILKKNHTLLNTYDPSLPAIPVSTLHAVLNKTSKINAQKIHQRITEHLFGFKKFTDPSDVLIITKKIESFFKKSKEFNTELEEFLQKSDKKFSSQEELFAALPQEKKNTFIALQKEIPEIFTQFLSLSKKHAKQYSCIVNMINTAELTHEQRTRIINTTQEILTMIKEEPLSDIEIILNQKVAAINDISEFNANTKTLNAYHKDLPENLSVKQYVKKSEEIHSFSRDFLASGMAQMMAKE